MARGGSSKMEKKARGTKRMLKKSHKKKKTRTVLDGDDGNDDGGRAVGALAYSLPIPTDHDEDDDDEEEDGDDGFLRLGKKKKRKKKGSSADVLERHTQVSIHRLPTPDFSACAKIQKVFLKGWTGSIALGEDLKQLRKSISVNVKGSDVERYEIYC